MKTASTPQYLAGLRAAVHILLGGKCSQPGCRVRDRRMLTIDHRHGGGVQHRKRLGGGRRYLVVILHELRERGGLKKYRLLCHNHNWLAHVSRRKHG